MDKKIPEGVVLTAAYALSREWNLHYPDAVRMAALVLSVGQQHPESQPEAWITPGGDVSRSFHWCLERCLPDQQPRPLYAAQQPVGVDVRKLLSLAEQWERYADGCRPYGFIKEAELLEHCAQCIRQALGISADAGESSLILPGRDPLVEKLLSIAIKDKEKERLTARAEQSEVRGGVDAPGSREWMAEVCRAAALSLAAHGVWNDQLLRVADWIAQQPAAPTLAKHQPCGCVICTCEDERQCQGCGAKHCGNRADHPPYVVQQPAAVDEAAAIRAFEEHIGSSSDVPCFEGELELWLTAWRKALAQQTKEIK